MRIAILLPMVWSVRNVVHGGVLRTLAQRGVETHVLVPHGTREADGGRVLFGDADFVHPLIGAPARSVRGKALLESVLASAFHRQQRHRSHRIYRRWFSRSDGALLRARNGLVEAAGAVAATARGTRVLERMLEGVSRRARDLEPVRRQLRDIDPDLIWSTVNVSGLEQPYRFAARDLGVPIATSILSFDNLTSRGPLPRDDWYLVWGTRMRAQVRRLYPELEASRVTITGTPQFDFHRQPSCRWTRARTLDTLGVPVGGQYVLYGASHAMLTPDEPRLVAQLARRMRAHPFLTNRTLVVRIHPLDDERRWTPYVGERAADRAAERVRLSSAFASPATDGWTVPSEDDHARLTSSLLHADACLNVASTLTLDAAILDRPVIGLDLAGEPDSPRDILYAEYGADHYAPLVASGGLRLAHTWDELLALLIAAIETPARDREARARMVEETCGPVDGRAAERIAQTLVRAALEARRARATDPRCKRLHADQDMRISR